MIQIYIMRQIRPLNILIILFYFILNPSLSGQINSVNCLCNKDSLSIVSLNWNSLDSNIKLQFVNNHYIDSNGFSNGKVSIIIFDTNTEKTLNEYMLRVMNFGECDRSYYDYCVVNSLTDLPKVIIIRDEFHNDCEDIHDVGIFKLELRNGKIEYIKIH